MRLTEKTHVNDERPHHEDSFANRLQALLGPSSRRTFLFVLFNLLFGAVFASHLVELFRFSLHQQHYSHFMLIPLVSFYLLITQRHALLERAQYGVRSGVMVGLGGVLCYLLGLVLQPQLAQNDFLTLTMLGMVAIWIAGFVVCFGRRAARMALFPLGFLLFAVPIPEVLLNGVITALQYASAEMVHVLFKLAPVPVFRAGIDFSIPGLSIEVARECSSIRSSLALLITSVIANHLMLRRWWSKATVLLLVFPLAVFKNGVRIVTLSLLTIYVDRGFIEGSLHTRGGIVFFCLALLILLPILLGLRKLETRT
jgi:exosortase